MGWLEQVFREQGWIAWGIVAMGLAAAELLTLDLTLLMLAIGAAAAGITWFVVPGMLWIQLLAGIVVAVLTLWLLRPSLLARVRNSPGYRSSLDQLRGAFGLVIAEVTANKGEVRVNGQLWQARPFDPATVIESGQNVEVYGLDGVTLLVRPVELHEILRQV